jgi:hypothetical protein
VKKAQEALEAELSPETLAAAPEAAQQLLEEVLSRLQLFEPEAAEAEARRILLGLGFTTAQMDGPLSKLSGEVFICRVRVFMVQFSGRYGRVMETLARPRKLLRSSWRRYCPACNCSSPVPRRRRPAESF